MSLKTAAKWGAIMAKHDLFNKNLFQIKRIKDQAKAIKEAKEQENNEKEIKDMLNEQLSLLKDINEKLTNSPQPSEKKKRWFNF